MISRFNARTAGSPVLAIALLFGVTSVALTQPQLRTGNAATVATIGAAVAAPATTAPLLVTQTTPSQPITAPAAQQAEPARATPAAQVVATEPAPAVRIAPQPLPREQQGMDMGELIEQVSRNIKRRVVVDPRARGTIALYGQRPEEIDFPGLLTILRVNGFTAIELNDYVSVVPIGAIRSMPVPIVAAGESYPDDLFVSARIGLSRACAIRMMQMMRQLVSQEGTLMADDGSNSMVIVDTYANYKRIEATVKDLDANTKPGTQCDSPPSAPKT